LSFYELYDLPARGLCSSMLSLQFFFRNEGQSIISLSKQWHIRQSAAPAVVQLQLVTQARPKEGQSIYNLLKLWHSGLSVESSVILLRLVIHRQDQKKDSPFIVYQSGDTADCL
jgi:hypothetical protein